MKLDYYSKFTGKNIKIGIIDSGLSYDYPINDISSQDGVSIYYDESENKVCIESEYNDKIGHGTAIYNIIKNQVPDAQITVIKIFYEELKIQQKYFEEILNYICNEYNFDIINLSLGITYCDQSMRMYEICDKFYKRGTIIISAFSNTGELSYPAMFDNVIGVDSSFNCTKVNDFEYIEDKILNIRARGIMQKVAWVKPSFIMAKGNSFTCGYVTAFTAKIMEEESRTLENVLDVFKSISKRKHIIEKPYPKQYKMKDFKINKAAIFPFNKEMHALIQYSELLDFKIVDVYDLRLSGHVGSKVSNLLKHVDLKEDYIIKNIREIEYLSLDTLIIGHTDQLLKLTGEIDLKDNLIANAIKNKINIYSYDSIKDNLQSLNKRNYSSVYWPHIENKYCLNNNRFGKLYKTSKPVLGVFGTQSRQGKFTLQLWLRKKFQEEGYSVGQLGTEPNSLLFGMDCMFHSGYKSNITGTMEDCMYIINNMIWDISNKNTDIIIVGSQSGVITYNNMNINNYPLIHQIFLQAVCPDAALLCINPYDDIEFIKRSIKAVEGLGECTVIALVCFPMVYRNSWAGFIGSKKPISEDEIMDLKEQINSKLNIPIYILGQTNDMLNMYNDCLDFFS